MPELTHWSPISLTALDHIQTLSEVCPFEDVDPFVVIPLLIRRVGRCATVQLHSCAVCVDPFGHVQTLVAEDANSAIDEDPALILGFRARGKDNGRSICVIGRREAFLWSTREGDP